MYKDLKDLGYDWDELLDTRGYWVFEEHAADEKPFLSTKDLLEMRKGLYTPWWHAKAGGKAAKKEPAAKKAA